jgi:phosphoserine aminotransferase
MTTATLSATKRIYNFSSGPAMLPLPVLEQAQRELLSLPGVGMSVLEISHRSKTFIDILEAAKQSLIEVLNVPKNYHVLFLQGGGRLLFSMVPMNLLRGRKEPANYVVTGTWGGFALPEAKKEGPVTVAYDGKATNYDRLPSAGELKLDADASYVYMVSNETIQGVQFPGPVNAGNAPLVCDASSDILSRPVDISKYGIYYACAQKNAGPAGVTIAIVRDDLLERSQDTLPGYMNIKNHVKENSLYNTPPCFAIYLTGLVSNWVRDEMGGLAKMGDFNREKANLLYDVIDQSQGFYAGHAQKDCRSIMNVTFRLPSEELTKKFIAEADAKGMNGLAGHRSVGGCRASIYNAMPRAGLELLRDFMLEFKDANSK